MKTDKRLRPATVNRELACLKALFSFVIKADVLAKNPVSRVKFLGENNQQTRVLNYTEQQSYLSNASPVNEMVRRLILLEVWRIVLAGSRRIIDMQLRSVGIDLGKTNVSPRSSQRSGQGAVAEKVYPEAAHHLYSQHADLFDWDGGMLGGSLPCSRLARARP